MERSERAGLGIALVGHAGLFALLSLRFMQPPPPVSLEQPVEVSLVDDVALTQAAPPSPIPPSMSEAPEQGKPEKDAAPPEAVPVPTPAKPAPSKAKPAKPSERPDADRLAAIAADAERADAQRADKAAAAKAAHDAWVEKVRTANAAKAEAAREAAEARTEAARQAAAAKAEAAKVAAARAEQAHAAAVARAEEARAAAATRAEQARAVAAAKAEQARADAAAKADAVRVAAAARPRGSRLGSDFLKGLSNTPTKASPSAAAPGVMDAKAAADIGSAILRQVQPCANRQVNPAPGFAEQIRVELDLKLNRDGSLAAPPSVINHSGTDVNNRRYLERVEDLAIATFVGCAPLRGLPINLYDGPKGWRSFQLWYQLPK